MPAVCPPIRHDIWGKLCEMSVTMTSLAMPTIALFVYYGRPM